MKICMDEYPLLDPLCYFFLKKMDKGASTLNPLATRVVVQQAIELLFRGSALETHEELAKRLASIVH